MAKNISRDNYTVLGVHFGHDAGAAIVVDGQIVADVSEERFTRVKHSSDLPFESVEYCLKTAGISVHDIDEIAVAGITTGDSFESMFGLSPPQAAGEATAVDVLATAADLLFSSRPTGSQHVLPGLRTPAYYRELFLNRLPKVAHVDHHLAHAAAAYYTASDPRKMIIATMDGTGDDCSSCIWLGQDGLIRRLAGYGHESSIGWFYSNVTEALGWWHGDGEGKTMGLAPYGDGTSCKGLFEGFYPKFRNGELREPHRFPPFSSLKRKGALHWHSDDALKLARLIEGRPREDAAAEAQHILEEEVIAFVLPWLEREQTSILATSGGVFLNVKLNQRIWMSGKVTSHHPYPNPGDAGLALGAALFASARNGPLRNVRPHLYWGPSYSNQQIEAALRQRGIAYRRSTDICREAAERLAENRIVGWFQGRMESGPRALGNRSILMSPEQARNKDILNGRVKFREGFRPFCPSVLDEAKDVYFLNPRSERFMITSFDCVADRKSQIPAVVHVDGTVRPQTVSKDDNPRYWRLISEFGKRTGVPVVLNTSMNVRGEPMACSPRDAIRCFFDTGMDVLCLEDFIVEKPREPDRF